MEFEKIGKQTYAKINGKTFEVTVPRDFQALNRKYAGYSGCDLHSWYDRWSHTKQDIYDEWKTWFRRTDNVMCMGICSANHMTFTITGVLTDDDLIGIGRFVITRNHNRLYLKSRPEI